MYLSDTLGRYWLCGVAILDCISSNSGAAFDFSVAVAAMVACGDVGATSSSLHSLALGRRRDGGGAVVDVVMVEAGEDVAEATA